MFADTDIQEHVPRLVETDNGPQCDHPRWKRAGYYSSTGKQRLMCVKCHITRVEQRTRPERSLRIAILAKYYKNGWSIRRTAQYVQYAEPTVNKFFRLFSTYAAQGKCFCGRLPSHKGTCRFRIALAAAKKQLI